MQAPLWDETTGGQMNQNRRSQDCKCEIVAGHVVLGDVDRIPLRDLSSLEKFVGVSHDLLKQDWFTPTLHRKFVEVVFTANGWGIPETNVLPHQISEFINFADLKRVLGLGDRLARKLIRQGRIPVIRVGPRKCLFERQAVVASMRAMQEGGLR